MLRLVARKTLILQTTGSGSQKREPDPPNKTLKETTMKIAKILGLLAALAGFSLTSCGSAPEEVPVQEVEVVEPVK
jgi:hypothetical protein